MIEILLNGCKTLTHPSIHLSLRMTKPTKWHVRPAKTQIRLSIRPVWSESSLCTLWVAKDPLLLNADSENSDQTGRMHRLIWVFTGSTGHLVGFVVRRIIFRFRWCKGQESSCHWCFDRHWRAAGISLRPAGGWCHGNSKERKQTERGLLLESQTSHIHLCAEVPRNTIAKSCKLQVGSC